MPLTTMQSLTLRRGRAKGALTRISTYASAISEETTISDIDVKRQKLEEIWVEYHQIDREIIEAATDMATVTDTDLIEFEDSYYRTIKLLNDHLSELSRQETVNYTGYSSNTIAPQHEIRTEKQLPKIQIKPFSGDLTEWDTFRDLYVSTVHNNQHLSNSQKFYYLKSFLVGEPSNLLTHISVSDTNYTEAWEKLNSRYDKKGHIANALVKKFIHLSSLTQSNYNSLRKLVDNVDEIIRGLRALGADAETRDIWLTHLLLNKLDIETQNAWATISSEEQFPRFDTFLAFLEKRCNILATSYSTDRSRKLNTGTPQKSPQPSFTNFKSFHTTTTTPSCLKCQAAHELYQCTQFSSLSPQLRRSFVQSNSLCFNCLRAGHRVTFCRSLNSCKQCHSRHHSLLHLATNPTRTLSSSTPTLSSRQRTPQTPSTVQGTPLQASTPIRSNHSTFQSAAPLSNKSENAHVRTYLPTAVVNTCDRFGTKHSVRLLLDSGSECSFISEDCATRLGLLRTRSNISVLGLSSTEAGRTNGSVTLKLESRLSDKFLTLTAYVMSKLTCLLPTFKESFTHCPTHDMLKLADPEYNQPGPIDILVGADKAFLLFENQLLRGPPGTPSAMLTIFGWVIAGELASFSNNFDHYSGHVTTLHSTVQDELDLKLFWELEEVTSHTHSPLSEDEQRTEKHFEATHFRSSDGKYVVELPFKDGDFNFGNSLATAITRQKSMERKFAQNCKLKQKYNEFMAEYLKLGHMSLVPFHDINISTDKCYYLPHHAVFKEDSSTTKLRVVFDGSSKHGRELSLNETLHIGAPIQRDLFSVCCRFRRHKYCFSADIQQMFRQIWVAEKHRDFQRIVWRDESTKPLSHYRLNTVTYGTAPAPYLSVRILKQLAKDTESSHPDISDIILHDFYVDDILSGADSINAIHDVHQRLVHVLSSAGFHLRKWSSNCVPFLASIPEDQREISPLALQDSASIKILGLCWCPVDDYFSYNIALPESVHFSKRSMLSEAARVFDPLGFLAPSVVLIKLLFQELWCRKLDWDESLPDDIAERWRTLRSEIAKFKNVKITRRIWTTDNFEFHGFCDASQKAYAAVIYCRSQDKDNVETVLVTAKTKAAPLKQISLPRLELCGAVLLARLFNKLSISFQNTRISFHAWTDSQVVLNWLSSPPRRWSTFIANRTSEILHVVPRQCWSHVRSAHNPADCASRGLPPSELIVSKLWWEGPAWLRTSRSDWPSEVPPSALDTVLLEERKPDSTAFFNYMGFTDNHILTHLLPKVSSWSKLYRIIGYCYRFCYNLRNKNHRMRYSLTTPEIIKAKTCCIKFVQRSVFPDDVNRLLKQQPLPSNSPLIKLTPFVDADNVVRVGGRISHSILKYAVKHPIILPKAHYLTQLIIKHTHEIHLHAGTSSLFSILRQTYWIFGCRNLIRKLVHDCVICFKQRKNTSNQLMGELPAERVQSSRPFSRVGVDYAGPITLRLFHGRKSRYSKGYICLFVCFATKALHLELVNDLTTNTFLSALDRFCARRGKPTEIFSDNGTNFQGAARKLDEMYQLLASQNHMDIVTDHLSKDNITWHFIPPGSPHFGGLWEAGVKSVKNNIKRVIGDHILTFEEMYTLLTRIEAILNSRPLIAVSDSDVDALTPAHFLIGQPYTAIAEPQMSTEPLSLSKNWSLIQHLSQGFWKRWHREYITSLQQRPKWQKIQRNAKVNDVVLLYESNLPAATWILGRIVQITAGSDGHVRVVKVNTSKGTYERPITKIAVLPFC